MKQHQHKSIQSQHFKAEIISETQVQWEWIHLDPPMCFVFAKQPMGENKFQLPVVESSLQMGFCASHDIKPLRKNRPGYIAYVTRLT